ncbi:GNAT family N-acetyltransferase [Candidatus Micrarchaeota archaeon]|nr:GNAT family N-acetyltransferase [Candidatus Micrarchaeota archaeon]MBU1930120.1 GNAT family N-acetyltransferase [Candidatus Micrarchaeota archaeon]
MKLTFRKLARKYFQEIHDLALEGWLFAYKHISKKDLKKLVDQYYSSAALENCLKKTRAGKNAFILSFENQKLIGFCHVAKKGNQGELCKLYIELNRIKKGIGSKLLSKGEQFLKKKSVKKYFTFVNKHNKIGIKFYLQKGFNRVLKKDKDDEFEPKALLYMEKRLMQKN